MTDLYRTKEFLSIMGISFEEETYESVLGYSHWCREPFIMIRIDNTEGSLEWYGHRDSEYCFVFSLDGAMIAHGAF